LKRRDGFAVGGLKKAACSLALACVVSAFGAMPSQADVFAEQDGWTVFSSSKSCWTIGTERDIEIERNKYGWTIRIDLDAFPDVKGGSDVRAEVSVDASSWTGRIEVFDGMAEWPNAPAELFEQMRGANFIFATIGGVYIPETSLKGANWALTQVDNCLISVL
jgi:hypothetical protein